MEMKQLGRQNQKKVEQYLKLRGRMIPTRNHKCNVMGNDVSSQLIQCFLKAKNHCSEPNVPRGWWLPYI